MTLSKTIKKTSLLCVSAFAMNTCVAYTSLPEIEEKPVKSYDNLPKAEIKRHNGVGSLFIDEVVYPRIGIGTRSGTTIREMANSGLNIIQTSGCLIGGATKMPAFKKSIDYQAKTILEAMPDAKIIVRLNIQPCPKFLEKNPGSRVTGENGETEFQDRFNNRFSEYIKYRPSWASMKWRQLATAEIREAVEYMASRPYAQNIAGIVFTAGHSGEFDQWFGGEKWPGGLPGDWCAESVSRFRDWLRKKYSNNVDKLRKAWGNDKVTFENAAIPSAKEKGRDGITLYDIARTQARFDYDEFFKAQIGEAIESWCKAAKLASGNRLITGAMLATGDSGSRIFMTSPWIDFGSGPPGYNNRQPGGNARHDYIGEEMRRHGKWYFDELDFRTMYYGATQFGVPDMATTLSVLKRAHALVTVEGCGGYWYEFRSTTYRHPQIWRLFRRQSEISELAAMCNRDNPAEIAFVTCDYTDWADLRLNVLDRMGAPYHALRLETLLQLENIPYKFIIVDVPVINTKQRELFDEKVKKDGRWIMFLRPAGAVNPDIDPSADLAQSSSLCGIKFAALAKPPRNPEFKTVNSSTFPALAELSLTPAKEQRLVSLHGTLIRIPRQTANVKVEDKDAVVMAEWNDGSIAAALKKHAQWTSIYTSTNDLNPLFMRKMAKASGVHQYEETFDDVIYMNGEFLCFHTRQEGTRKIVLPQAADLYDLYEKRFIGRGQKVYEVPMDALDTRFFFIGDPEERLKKISERIDEENLRRSGMYDKVRREQAQVPPPDLNHAFKVDPIGTLGYWLFLGPLHLKQERRTPKENIVFEENILRGENIKGEPGSLIPAPYKKERCLLGTEIVWRPLPYGLPYFYAESYVEDFERDIIFYAAAWLESAKGGEYKIHIESERGNQVWLDGKKLGESFYLQPPMRHGRQKTQFKVTLTPEKKHLLLLKVWSAGSINSGWGAKLLASNGTPATDVDIWLK